MAKSRMAKMATAALCAGALMASLGLAACGGSGSASANYADGTYTGQSQIHEDGDGDGYGVVTLTITDGAISDATFETYEPNGDIKGEDYGMVNGHIGNQGYYDMAQKALAANSEYAAQLVAAGTPDGVDAISGATISYNDFVEAAWDALDQASAAAAQ